ncbi:MAG: hypothetical protein OQK32_08405, partial [Gammaproteobacteria bacterium]|nr:hypothetical protein [Gammaproteobacteria bacterium]
MGIVVHMYVSNIQFDVAIKSDFYFLIRTLAFSFFITLIIVDCAQASPIDDTVDTAPQATSLNPGDINPKLEQLIHRDINTVLDVPPVYQRPLGVEAGPRVYVRKFHVTGVNEWPKFNISQQRVDTFVEKLRLEMQTIDAMNEHGLTEGDMAEIARRLKESLYDDDEKAAKDHAQFLKELRKNKKFREEMSIGQLQDVANQLTDLYRSAGFVIAQAYVPQQKIEDGVVNIHVQEGVLGRIVV